MQYLDSTTTLKKTTTLPKNLVSISKEPSNLVSISDNPLKIIFEPIDPDVGYIPKRYLDNATININIITEFMKLVQIRFIFDLDLIKTKDKITIFEFLFVYIKDPFIFSNITEVNHYKIYESLLSRVNYYTSIGRLMSSLLRYFFIPLPVELDPITHVLVLEKTFIYLKNLKNPKTEQVNFEKSLNAVFKGLSDLTRIANMNLILCSKAYLLFITPQNIYQTDFIIKQRFLLNFYKSENKLSITNIEVDGLVLVQILVEYLYNKDLQTLRLTTEQQKQIFGYLDQIFAYTTLYQFIKPLDENEKITEIVQLLTSVEKTFFTNLDLTSEAFSHRTYKKIINMLNNLNKKLILEYYRFSRLLDSKNIT